MLLIRRPIRLEVAIQTKFTYVVLQSIEIFSVSFEVVGDIRNNFGYQWKLMLQKCPAYIPSQQRNNAELHTGTGKGGFIEILHKVRKGQH